MGKIFCVMGKAHQARTLYTTKYCRMIHSCLAGLSRIPLAR